MFEVKSMTAAKGFTKEQQKYIADSILNEINANKNISEIVEIIKNQHKNDIKAAIDLYNKDKKHVCNLYFDGIEEEKRTIKIKLTDCNFKLEILNDLNNLIEFLTKKMHVNLQIKGEKENKIIEIIKKNYNNKIIKLKDGSITDGNILISSDYVGEYTENKENIINNSNKLTDLLNLNCTINIKNCNYRKEENIKFKNSNSKNKHCIFYKNKTSQNFIVIDQKYINLIKRIAKDNKIEVDFYVHKEEEKRKIKQVIVKEAETEKIIALIMPIFQKNLNSFESLPDVIEETKEETEEAEEKELNKINSEFIKAEAEAEAEEKTKNHTHINYVTGHEYSGHNAETLNNAMKKYNYVDSVWLGSYQAKKAKLQLKKENNPILISVLIENKNTGEIFKKYENIYNIADFEELKKIEDLEEFKNIVDELKKIS